MFRKMRRSEQVLSHTENMEIINRGSHGVLSCYGEDGYPYGIPMNYVYVDGIIYFHSAKEGHKMDALLKNNRVSFTIVDQDKIVSSEFTSYFRSVIAFGKTKVVEGEDWNKGMWSLVEKYSAHEPLDMKQKEVNHCNRSNIIAMEVEHLTGKEAKELVQEKRDRQR